MHNVSELRASRFHGLWVIVVTQIHWTLGPRTLGSLGLRTLGTYGLATYVRAPDIGTWYIAEILETNFIVSFTADPAYGKERWHMINTC